MKTISLPIGQPRIDIKITDINGVPNYKRFVAKVAGMGGLVSPMMFPFMAAGMNPIAKGFTTLDRIDAAEKEQDYTLLEIDDQDGRVLITLEEFDRIKSGDLRIAEKQAVTQKIVESGVELRMVKVCYSAQQIHDVGGDDPVLVETPLTIRKGDIPYIMCLGRLPAKAHDAAFDAVWSRLSAQMEVKGPENDLHLVWRPENAAEIREQIIRLNLRSVADWLHDNDVFGIVVPEPPKEPKNSAKKAKKLERA